MNSEIVGQRFNHLVVVKDGGARSGKGAIKWLCRCDCGNTTHVEASKLRSGATKRCGRHHGDVLREYDKKREAETPRTNPSLWTDRPMATNHSTGERNIDKRWWSGSWHYHVRMIYKGQRHEGGWYATLSEAVQARDTLRTRLWPGFNAN